MSICLVKFFDVVFSNLESENHQITNAIFCYILCSLIISKLHKYRIGKLFHFELKPFREVWISMVTWDMITIDKQIGSFDFDLIKLSILKFLNSYNCLSIHRWIIIETIIWMLSKLKLMNDLATHSLIAYQWLTYLCVPELVRNLNETL